MNRKLKKRLAVVTGVVVIVFILVLAVVASGTSAKTATVSEVLAGDVATGQKLEVTGIVADGSYSMDDEVTTFAIYDEDGDESEQLQVSYDGAISATFGNGVTAICTGKLDDSGVLQVSELVTKCPSKYENSEDSLSVDELLEYGDDIVDTTVKVSGALAEGSLSSVESDERLVLEDADTGEELSVAYEGAIPDGVEDGSSLVVTGSLSSDGTFAATDVALEG